MPLKPTAPKICWKLFSYYAPKVLLYWIHTFFFSFFDFFVVCLFAFMSIELISNDVICKFYTQQVGNIYIATGIIKILMEKIRIICLEEWLRCDCFQAFREANVKVVKEVQI